MKTDELIELFKDALPHGSGINSDWNIYPSKDGKNIIAENTFDTMNEVGFYDTPVDFQLVVPIKSFKDFKLKFTGGSRSQYYARKYMLRDYLDDTFAYAFEEIQKKVI